MGVKEAILALIRIKPRGVYQLRQDILHACADNWPINIGQIYTTTQRLERDGLIQKMADSTDTDISDSATNQPSGSEKSAELFEITPTGAAAAANWWETPTPASTQSRDELQLKIALALSQVPHLVTSIVDEQRFYAMRQLQQIKKQRHTRPRDNEIRETENAAQTDLIADLSRERTAFELEAQVRWLDYVQQRLQQTVNADTVRNHHDD